MFNLLKLLEERWKVTASLLKRITLYKTKENSIRHVSPSRSLISASDPTPATLNTPTSATSATSTTPVTPTTLDWGGLSPESLSLSRVFQLPPTYIFSTGIHPINKDPSSYQVSAVSRHITLRPVASHCAEPATLVSLGGLRQQAQVCLGPE